MCNGLEMYQKYVFKMSPDVCEHPEKQLHFKFCYLTQVNIQYKEVLSCSGGESYFHGPWLEWALAKKLWIMHLYQ